MAGPVPAILIRKSSALRSIEITGTGPVMTPENVRAERSPPIHAVSLTALILRRMV
jgi:hypothetical protein